MPSNDYYENECNQLHLNKWEVICNIWKFSNSGAGKMDKNPTNISRNSPQHAYYYWRLEQEQGLETNNIWRDNREVQTSHTE